MEVIKYREKLINDNFSITRDKMINIQDLINNKIDELVISVISKY